MRVIPSLPDLLEHPERALELSPEVAQDLLVHLLSLQTLLLARILGPTPLGGDGQQQGPAEDRLLKIKEAAARLGTSTDYLYRHAAKLPFTMRLGSRLRFSEHGIEQYIRQRRGKTA